MPGASLTHYFHWNISGSNLALLYERSPEYYTSSGKIVLIQNTKCCYLHLHVLMFCKMEVRFNLFRFCYLGGFRLRYQRKLQNKTSEHKV